MTTTIADYEWHCSTRNHPPFPLSYYKYMILKILIHIIILPGKTTILFYRGSLFYLQFRMFACNNMFNHFQDNG